MDRLVNRLIPFFQGELKEKAVRLALETLYQTLPEPDYFHNYGVNWSSIHLLTKLLKFVEDREAILQTVRQEVLRGSRVLQNQTREIALQFCSELGNLPSSIFPTALYSEIVDTIIEITEQWHWI